MRGQNGAIKGSSALYSVAYYACALAVTRLSDEALGRSRFIGDQFEFSRCCFANLIRGDHQSLVWVCIAV